MTFEQQVRPTYYMMLVENAGTALVRVFAKP